jgi:DNA-binding SARP family transcriptional activator
MPAPTIVHLSLAGTPSAHGAHGASGPHPLAAIDAALLLWLALEGPTPRARLAALLWPDTDADSARNSLRQRLFKLRKALGVDLARDGHVVALPAGATHDLDDADTVLGSLAPPARGEFAAWLEQQRTRRQGRLRRSLVELSAMAEAARDWDDALGHARELLALDPLSEDAHRRVMRLHYLAGDRAAALLAFDRCERVLKEEVGTRPSAETLALLATIEASGRGRSASGREDAAGGDGARHEPVPQGAMPASVLRPPRLVGRDAERAALEQAVAAGQVAAVIGEAGLGKSRLLQEALAGRPGTAYASARPGDAGVPFATLARLLRAAVAGADAAARLPPAARTDIARVLPELVPGEATAPRASGEGQRLALMRSVRALLVAAPAAPVTTVAVDDLHFADDASVEMLGHLIDDDEADGGPRLHWLLAWRAAEAGSPTRALHDALAERARLAPVVLAPLSQAALAELVDSLGLPGLAGAALAPGLMRRTGGNPMFVLETLKQAWVERRLASLAEASDAAHLPRPVSVGHLIQRRVAQLSPGAVALARVASIAGVDFSVDLAEHVLQASAMQFADAINELEAAQVLRGTQFAHDLVFEAVRASVPTVVAEHTHARVAGWLEAHGGEPARTARHWIDGRQPVRALPWLAQAAAAARTALRPREELAFLDEKSRIEEETGDLAAAFASAETALDVLGWSPQAELDYEARCGRLERLAQDDVQRCLALRARAELHGQRGDYLAAAGAAQQALRLALPLGDPALTARMRHAVGEACTLADRGAEAVVHLEAALVWFDVHASEADRALMHGALAVTYDNIGRLDEGRVHHEATLALARRASGVMNLGVAAANFACNRIDAGDLKAADAALAHDARLLAAYDADLGAAGNMHTLRALVTLHLGRFGDALREAESGVEAFRRVGSALLPRARQRLAQVWWQIGQHARALQQLEAAAAEGVDESLVGRVTQCWLRWECLRELGALGDLPAAREALAAHQALASAVAELDASWRPDLQLPLRLALLDAADPGAALERVAAVGADATRIGHRGTRLATHIRGAALALPHDAAQAAAHARSALALHDEGVRTVALRPAELWLHAGAALHAAGAGPEARAVLAAGRRWLDEAVATQLGPEQRDGFLYRNRVHAELLALAARAGAGA